MSPCRRAGPSSWRHAAAGWRGRANDNEGRGSSRSGSVQISAFTGELKFTFKCQSHHAVCCPAAIRALIAPPLGEQKACVYLERAEGWAHDHTGPNRAVTGLPPQDPRRGDNEGVG